MNRLIDLRQAIGVTTSVDALRRSANYAREQHAEDNTHLKVAVVAPSDVYFGLARMYEVFSDVIRWNFVVFRAADAALAWLGVPEDLMDDLNKDTQQ